MVAGKVRNFSSTGEENLPNKKLSAKGLMCWEPGVQFVQPGAWLRRELISKCGGIDEQFHYAFDWDFYIRYLYHFSHVIELNDLFVHFRLHENSKTQSLRQRFVIEEQNIVEKLFSLPEFNRIHQACDYKIQKTKWTNLLSEISKSNSSFIKKSLSALVNMPSYPQVSYSRQTVGAISAFLKGKEI